MQASPAPFYLNIKLNRDDILAFYRKDLSSKTDVAHLLTQLCQLNNIEWIRVLYCHPDHFSKELMNVVREEEKIVYEGTSRERSFSSKAVFCCSKVRVRSSSSSNSLSIATWRL